MKYLKFNQTPKENIKGFEVTHIYTPEKLISEEISKCSYIANIVDNPRDLLNKVDIVLVLTDEGIVTGKSQIIF